MSVLFKRQVLFARLAPRLLDWVSAQPNLGATFGEAYRPPEMVAIYAQRGTGSLNSVHPERLAVDLQLFRLDPMTGVWTYLTGVEDYRPAGVYWKSLNTLCRWGGDFSNRVDADHFSVESPEGHQ